MPAWMFSILVLRKQYAATTFAKSVFFKREGLCQREIAVNLFVKGAGRKAEPDLISWQEALRHRQCCPGLNPDELLNQDLKNNARRKQRAASRTEMTKAVRSFMRSRQRTPTLVKHFFTP